ncbi:hypothetical protein ABZ541_05035 [Micromonospora sediminicola]|uniref:hypothetical protein n=1 Tax=Micromonospora sediminicola TaxID=946078 RepID=UPI0033EBEAC7
MARTYRELESAGLIVSRRGRGTRVAAAWARPPAAVLHERAATFVRDARLLGADDEQIRAAVAAALAP